MKTIKAKTISELQEKVYKTDLYKSWLKIKEDVENRISKCKENNEYIERDLYEELYSINRALNLNYHSSIIKRGVFNNIPYMCSGGGHSCITLIEYPYSFYIFDHYSFH